MQEYESVYRKVIHAISRDDETVLDQFTGPSYDFPFSRP